MHAKAGNAPIRLMQGASGQLARTIVIAEAWDAFDVIRGSCLPKVSPRCRGEMLVQVTLRYPQLLDFLGHFCIQLQWELFDLSGLSKGCVRHSSRDDAA